MKIVQLEFLLTAVCWHIMATGPFRRILQVSIELNETCPSNAVTQISTRSKKTIRSNVLKNTSFISLVCIKLRRQSASLLRFYESVASTNEQLSRHTGLNGSHAHAHSHAQHAHAQPYTLLRTQWWIRYTSICSEKMRQDEHRGFSMSEEVQSWAPPGLFQGGELDI